MSYRVIYSGVWRQRVERLLIAAQSASLVHPIKTALVQLHEIMEHDPVGSGEPLYRLKHAGLMVYIVVRRYVSVNFAVDEDRNLVYVMKFSFSGNHPYPPEFEEILNPKKS